jgi:hypothetical protein
LGASDAGTVDAVLTSGWVQRASVLLEVDTWSTDRVLVGMRHRARAVPWWSVAYYRAAHEAVALITDAIEEWADEPLRTVLARDVGLARR